MSDAGRGAFIDERAALEARQIKGADERVRFILHNGLSHCVPACGNGFVTPCSPAAVDLEMANRRQSDERTGIRCNIHRPSPVTHDLQPAE